MTADLHARLVAAVQQRLDVAWAATPGPWQTSAPDTVGEWVIYDEHWAVAETRAYTTPTTIMPGWPKPESYIDPNANAAFVVANDPATIIRHCERDLRVLERHIVSLGFPTAPICKVCRRPGYMMVEAWPCPEILDLAAAYAVEVDRG